MNKSIFAFIALATILTSARYIAPSDGRVGYQAPNMTLSNSDNQISLQDLKGNYVVVNFWSSALPAPRLANKQLAAAAGQRDNVVYLAVNLDRSQGLFDQIIALDNIDIKSQYHVSQDEQERIMNMWHQQPESLGSFLINPNGKIIQLNPSLEDLAAI